jgi:hypothetical protein
VRWLIVAVALGLVAAACWLVGAGLVANPSPVAAKVVDYRSSEWLDALQQGAEVEFVRSREAVGQPTEQADHRFPKLTSLGPLDEAGTRRLRSALGVVASARSLARARANAESGDAEDYREFLFETYVHSKVLAAESKIESGDYITLKAGAMMPALPAELDLLGQLNLPGPKGQRVDLFFVLDLSVPANSAVRANRRQLEEFDAFQAEVDMETFNAKPFDERKRLVEASEAAVQKLVNWPPNGSTAEAAAVRAAILPRRMLIDKSTFIARLRSR